MAMLVEQAGGAASTGRAARSWTSCPTGIHQRVPVILGSRDGGRADRALSRSVRPRGDAGVRDAAVQCPLAVPDRLGAAMSRKHPIIAITGSSGAGTTTVTTTFEQIFRREGVNAAIVEGDAFHRYDRARDARADARRQAQRGNNHFSHFGPEANLFEELEALFRSYGETGTRQAAQISARRRGSGAVSARSPAPSRRGRTSRPAPTCCSTRGCTAACVHRRRSISPRHADLLVGVVPIINLEWIQKLHRDKKHARLLARGRGRHDPAPHAGLRELHLPAVQPRRT